MKLSNAVIRRRSLNSFWGLSVAIITYGVLGCTSPTVSFTSVDFCSQPVSPAMARMVISRTSSVYGGGYPLRVFDNNQPIGDIGSGGRLCWDRFPGIAVISGRHVLKYQGREKVDAEQEQSWRVKVETRANATYYLRSSFGQWELRTGPD